VTFNESGLTFTFPSDWLVYKYDQHRFYKYVSGYGLKGVDFMIITDEGDLILLEVKNYFNRFKDAKESPTLAIKNDPMAYAKKFAGKYEDSFQLINSIHQYYQQRHRYRWFIKPLFQYLPKGLQLKTDWGFWTKAHELLEQGKVKLMLWMELNENIVSDREKQIDEPTRAHIVEQFPQHPFSIHWIDLEKSVIQVKLERNESNKIKGSLTADFLTTSLHAINTTRLNPAEVLKE